MIKNTLLSIDTEIEVIQITDIEIIKIEITLLEWLKIKKEAGVKYIAYQKGFSQFNLKKTQ